MRKFTAILLIITAFSCGKNDNPDNAPIVPVDVYINMSLPQYQSLNVPGGWAYANGGVKGILVYRRDQTEFVAYDRNCTYQGQNSCGAVEVDSSNILADCNCDGSVYNIYDGSVTQGPATLPLRAYNTYFDGNFTLRVYN